MDRDAIVIGAGPAGAIAALLLARAGAETLLVDTFGDSGYKIGESLPGIARHLLGALGLRDVLTPESCIPCTGNLSAWGSNRLEHRPGLLDPYGAGVHLDRAAFDRAIVTAAVAAGATPLPGRFKRAERIAGRWSVAIESDGRCHTARSAWVIDCTGRRSAFAASVGVRRLTFDRQVAVVALLERGENDDDASIILEASPDGWWYTAPVPNRKRVVTYFTDGDLIRSAGVRTIEGLRSQAGHTHHMRAFVAGRHLHRRPTVVLASSSRLTRAAAEGWVAAGDAATALDPLASIGIINSIKCAQAAAKAVFSQGAGLAAYSEQVRIQHQKDVERSCAYYRMEMRWRRSLFWSRRIATLQKN